MGDGGSGDREFGELLREYRKGKYSQEALANQIGMRTSTIQDLEKNQTRVPYPKTLKSICEALELSPEQRAELVAAAGRRERAGAVRAVVARDEGTDADTQPPGFAASTSAAETPTRSALPRRLSNVSRRARILLAVGTVVFLVGAALLGARLVMPQASEATILSPFSGQDVESPLTANGTAELQPGFSLWLLVRPVGDTTYYLTDKVPVVVNHDGEWASRLTLGRGPEDEGEEYDLFALVAPNGGMVDQALVNKPADQFSARFKSIPDDSQATHHIRVELGSFVGND
ncbi:Transcriptional regulator, contains XRE-family HTH domain [Geodermatophilus amargosae]|uniref:Transcriptional regulator, contains XRE-family HTH domain n=1 Tax=Geodermatophilus amargosae TaxID=1296565 RepID=A0A1I7AVW4_9ACTN|nr:helix-turn-helix transcriptional regulator [Geodermatophilus amargosae]SFT79046.1 Transcriptional regulator, contains XRE-family HTH domain [Geodermatophilus amargosae]